MRNYSTLQLIELVKKHLRSGDHTRARKVALYLTAEHPTVLEGWLFLSGLCEPNKRLVYLAKAAELAPEDPRVIKAIAWAKKDVAERSQKAATGQNDIESPPLSPIITSEAVSRTETLTRDTSWLTRLNQNGFFRGFLHMGKKAILIALTIFIGTFITIQIMNRDVVTGPGTVPAQLDALMERQVEQAVREFKRENKDVLSLSTDEHNAIIDGFREEIIAEAGLNLPPLQRHFKWTLNALTFNWGRLRQEEYSPTQSLWSQQRNLNLNEIILQSLPNTLLLVTTAYLLVFLMGIPLALSMSRNYGKWYDKLFSFFAALSSIPSWVYGIILIAIFALEFRLLPAGRMVGNIPPDTRWGYIPIVAQHMILPVAAIFLSIFFNLVYSWRTYFVAFSSEDYVDLGKAVGMTDRKLQRNYILKPSWPYVITSFSLMFATFWQMTMALEVVFNWPGLGWLYITRGLPNLWGESLYPGDLVISISLVVMFGYLMGFIVLLLDLVYVIVDPRIRLSKGSQTLNLNKQKISPIKRMEKLLRGVKEPRNGEPPSWSKKRTEIRSRRVCISQQKQASSDSALSFKKFRFWSWLKRATTEIKRYPSAIIGISIISLLIIGSLYAVMFLPYEKIGDDWSASYLVGRPTVPKLAKPTWTNLFYQDNYLSSIILDSKAGDAIYEVVPISEDTNQVLVTFDFEYNYATFPSEMFLYISSNHEIKRPFVSMLWRTPDGRELALKNVDIPQDIKYDFDNGIAYRRWVNDNPKWGNWFNTEDTSQNPPYYLLFADPDLDTPQIVQGKYELLIDGFTFEENSDIQAELVMLGQVYGAAGTDFYRRDLIVPLLWGMPYALLIGLGCALFTTIISMVLSATGVWFGGWVDNLVQRLIDVNLVLPILAIAVMAYAFLGISVWTILIVYVFLSAFGTPTKNFRAAFLQIKNAPYIEAAKAYGAKNSRVIFKYMVPRLIPVLAPQLVILIPAFVFLEATLGFFNIRMLHPTWGTVIYEASMRGGLYGSRFWILQPIALLLLTGLGFALFGLALERILNPRLSED